MAWARRARSFAGAVGCVSASCTRFDDAAAGAPSEETVTNWSGTHSATTQRYYEPSTAAELQELVRRLHKEGRRARPVGQALSPNGLGMSSEGMISVARLDRVLEVDLCKKTITVEAGCRVRDVLEELRKHGLTLANFSSIQEQQLGGWMQVAAHGTGAGLPTVEEQIVSMRLLTPGLGLLDLSEQTAPELFSFAKAGLGCLGIVTDMTLQCVDRHQLLEQSYVTDAASLSRGHARRLRENRHVRYMWIPHTKRVVVVLSNPHGAGETPPERLLHEMAEALPEGTKLEAALALAAQRGIAVPEAVAEEARGGSLSFPALRDHMLAENPLDVQHVRRVNEVEAAYWQLSSGARLADSTEVLGFDCGGEQWVLEVAFPVAEAPRGERPRDIAFVLECMEALEAAGVPAPAPIEQRWTASSSAALSPAHGAGGVHSWVGVIMYLPAGQSAEGLAEITRKFEDYVDVLRPVFERYGAVPHWAKIEPRRDAAGLEAQREMLRRRYDLERFGEIRKALDPKGILSNRWARLLF